MTTLPNDRRADKAAAHNFATEERHREIADKGLELLGEQQFARSERLLQDLRKATGIGSGVGRDFAFNDTSLIEQ